MRRPNPSATDLEAAPVAIVDTLEATTPIAAAPVDVAAVDAVTRLLAQLERTALAQRPVVVHQAPAAAPAMYAAPQAHPGIAVHVPAAGPVAPAPTMTRAVDKPRNIWPLVFMVSGCTGVGAMATAAATGSQYAILAVFACVAVWGTATYRLVFER
jgi:hypothetical protein